MLDAEIEITTPDLEHKAKYFIEVKRQIQKETVGIVINFFKKMGANNVLLATDYVNPIMADRLKRNDIQFIDTCGNAYINKYPIYIFVKGNKQTGDKAKGLTVPRAFKMGGVKIIYALLCNPGLEDTTFRKIGKAANVALGTVDAVMKDLIEIGFLIDKGKYGRKLVNKEKLLERWATAFPEVLRPKIMIGRFTAKNKYWWENAQLPEGFYWGGEVAAAKMTEYLRPEIITVYTTKYQEQLLLNFKLRRDPEGEIEILKAFWGKGTNWELDGILNPLLIYVDLLATGDPRNIETANLIYENELNRFIREN